MSDPKEETSYTRFNYKLVSVGLGTNSIILIDVRDISKRLIYGRIPGSLHVPRKLFENRIIYFNRGKYFISISVTDNMWIYFIFHLVKEVPIAFNYSAATAKEFEGEYDFKRPSKKEKDRKKTIVLVSDSIIYNSDKQNDHEENCSSENQAR